MNFFNFLFDMIALLFVALCLLGIKITKPIYSFNSESYLTLDNSKCYRGIFSLLVVLHHISLICNNGFLFKYFKYLGLYPVAFFFFLSGYGLQKSYMIKGESYKKGFLLRRLPSVLLPFVFIAGIFWIYSFCMGNVYSLKIIVQSIIKIDTFLPRAWYITVIIIFYFAYWILMIVCKKNYFLMIIGAIIWYALYLFYCIKTDCGFWCYASVFVLIFGMVWATYEQKLLSLIKRIYLFLLPVVFFVFLFLFYYQVRFVPKDTIIPLKLLSSTVTSLLFVFFVLLLLLKFKVGNKALKFLGGISLEIYLSHGMFIEIFRSKYLHINNDFIFTVAIICSTLIFSFAVHKLLAVILNKYHSFLEESYGKQKT